MIFWQIAKSYCVEIATVIILVLVKVWHTHKMDQSKAWPVSKGKISKVVVEKGSYRIKLLYSYHVEGEYYPFVGRFEKRFLSEYEAEHWGKALSRQTLPVHFNPKKPSESVLWEPELESIVHSSIGNENMPAH